MGIAMMITAFLLIAGGFIIGFVFGGFWRRDTEERARSRQTERKLHSYIIEEARRHAMLSAAGRKGNMVRQAKRSDPRAAIREKANELREKLGMAGRL